ncbi:ATP-binding protein [Mesorhizobium sp. M0644]|uniref:AAA family ATPase n=1 Tax=unclassified Mesorhizobium TaxID=325217 RepID=UPI0033392534
MIPGGIADKLGNRYEAKWLVRSLMDVLSGKAEWLQFENIDTEFHGFEFGIRRDGLTEWHQTKISSPGGNWAIGALGREGILSAFANRLSKDATAHCHFVSQDNAGTFHKLTEKARLANGTRQFLDALSQDQNDAFQQLLAKWATTPDTAYEWLQRSHVVTISETTLEWTIQSFGDLYFLNGGASAFANLRDIAEKNFNKLLTGASLRSLIRENGVLTIKDWALDPTIGERLKEETEAYLGTYVPFGAGGEVIQRSESHLLIQEILDPSGAELILLTGVAGSGKSGIVRSAISDLVSFGIPHLAFRVDQCLHCSTREELGRHLFGREEGPASTLKGAFPSTRSVLIIDQVDAISEVSGRDGKVKEVIFRLIADAHNFQSIKVVVICRTFDLESDPRLKQLKELRRAKQIDVPLFSWGTDVEPILVSKNVPVDRLSGPQRRLLELPINLAVFLEIDEKHLVFQSRSALHEKLIEKKQRVISKTLKPAWTVVQALGAMCEWMSKRQQLDAPISVLDPFPRAIDVLTSEGLIVLSRGRVNFFHESFFDHIFARSFVFREQRLVDMLRETEQHLFRRTQVRQILEALRQNDFSRYADELSSLLFGEKIRFHIKFAICQWLTTIETPTDREFEIVQDLDTLPDKYNQLFRRAVLSSHVWFDFLSAKQWIYTELECRSEKRTDTLLWWLSSIAGERPREISELLRRWWAGDAAKAEQLVSWFGFVHRKQSDDDLLQLCCDVVASHPLELFKDRGRDRITMLLHVWGEKSPEKCGQLIEAIFDAWYAQHPGQNPFDRDQEKVIEGYSLEELLKKAPKALAIGFTGALARAVDLVIAEGRAGSSWYSFNYRSYSGNRFGFDHFLGVYVAALKKVAEKDPSDAAEFLARLDPDKHECFMHIHLETIQANPTALAERLPNLVANKLAFESGWQGADWMSLATACREIFPHLVADQRCLIENRISQQNEEIEYASRLLRRIKEAGETGPFWTRGSALRALNRSGHKRWCILETIGEDRLSQTSRLQLSQLRRKFRGWQVDEPSQVEAHFVGSPIKRHSCERMSDRHWLSAIERYDNDEDMRRGRGFVDGGARQLAGELQEAAKKNPQRFSALLLQIPEAAHKSYAGHILSGLADAENALDEWLITAIRHAHQLDGRPYGNEIARLLINHPHLAATSDIADALIWYAMYGEASESEDADTTSVARETLTIDHLIQRGGGLHIRGINGVRGWTWEALGAVLWHVPKLESAVWHALDIAVEQEMLIGVRCCMMKPLTPLFNADKNRFESTLRKLVGIASGSPIETHINRLAPLVTHTGVSLFPYVLSWLPELGRELISHLLGSGDRTKELIAAWFVFGESFRHPEFSQDADDLSAKSVDHRRLMADVAGDVLTWAEHANRADILLRRFFSDEDKEVRSQAADAFRRINPDEVARYRDLTREFLRSPAYADSGFAVLHMLEGATCDVLDLVVEAAGQTIIDLSKNGNQNGRRGTDVHRLQDMLKREYVSSEKSPEARTKILDMIDLMLSREIHGAESIVSAHDRW